MGKTICGGTYHKKQTEVFIAGADDLTSAKVVAQAGDYTLLKAARGVAFVISSTGVVLAEGKREAKEFITSLTDSEGSINKMLKALKKSF